MEYLSEKGENMNLENKKKNKFNRYIGLLIIMVMIFGILINQMVNLQVINGAEYYNRANVEFIKNIDNQSPRGEILDQKGRVLATSTQSYNLIYVDTMEVRKVLFKTMDKVRGLLLQSNQEINDTLALKSDPYRFEFGSNDADYIRRSELRWKKDRGINDYLFLSVVSKETGKSKISELNEKETDYLDELILAFTPTETYYYLMKFYDLYEALDPTKEEKELFKKMDGEQIHEALLKEFDEETIRSYLLIKDNIKMESYSGSKAVTLVQNMSEDSAFIFLQQLSDLPGIDVETNPIRIYPYETLGAHVIGYLNPIPEGSKDHYEERGYDISKDYVGVSGIESAFEERLKGNKGVRTVEVDKNGRPTRELFELEPYPGNNIELTLDANLQNTAERALEDMIINLSEENTKHSIAGYYQDSSNANRGAVVAIEVATGNVLALASYPKYDPNIFAVPGRLTDEIYQELFDFDYRNFASNLISEKNITIKDPETNNTRTATFEDLFRVRDDGTILDYNDLYPIPTYNYATQGLAPSGSTFKLITGLAALEEGVIGANTILNDGGSFVNDQIGTAITNEGGGSYGATDMAKAIAKSSNVYFADVGYRLYKAKGLNAIAEWAWKLGLGHNPNETQHSTTGIEITENLNGNVYNHETKVELTKRLFMFDVVDFLKKGVSRYNRGTTFKPLNIERDDSDVESIKNGKEEIKEVIRRSLDISLEDANKGVKKDFNTVAAELTEAFQNYINLLPEEQRLDLSTANAYALEVATKVVFDQSTELVTPRNVINSALGQGENQFTLLQTVNALSTIVNGGTRFKTNLVSKIINPDGEIIKEYQPTVLENVEIKPSTVEALKKGLFDATQPGGVVYQIFKDFPINNGGKTGTATWKTNQEEFGRAAYGVYTGVAPIDNPEIAVGVIIYDATRGWFVAPVALAVFEEYFEERLKTEYPAYVRQYNYDLPAPKTLEVHGGSETDENVVPEEQFEETQAP